MGYVPKQYPKWLHFPNGNKVLVQDIFEHAIVMGTTVDQLQVPSQEARKEQQVEKGITKNQIITELSKSPHGKLEEYVTVGQAAARQEPEFLAHLIAWNQVKGQIRDSKVALPIISIRETMHEDFTGNAMAHLAMLDPRNLLKALRFMKSFPAGTRRTKLIGRFVERYLRNRESNWAHFERGAIQHRRSIHELYALCHIKPATMVDQVLFKGVRPRGSMFEAVANLKSMSNSEAAGTIMERRIPHLVALGALGPKAKDQDLVMALINQMSPTELVTNTQMLERMGIKTVPALRAAYEQALTRAASSKKTTLKTTRAAEAIGDEGLSQKLRDLQEKQIKTLGGVDGNWLVLGDKSGSMREAIEVSRRVAATLAKMVKGQVHLIFFDTSPRYINATGKTYEDILAQTKHVEAGGGTSIGCGLMAIAEKDVEIDGIAIVSDGGENQPPSFAQVYTEYSQKVGKQVPVYFYRTVGEGDSFSPNMKRANLDLQVFDLTGGVDYYSLPNLVQTMRTQRYSLVDEIMDQPLLKLEDVLKNASSEKGEKVYA